MGEGGVFELHWSLAHAESFVWGGGLFQPRDRLACFFCDLDLGESGHLDVHYPHRTKRPTGLPAMSPTLIELLRVCGER